MVYDEVVSSFAARTEPALLEQVARALVSKGATLAQLDRSEDAISVWDQVLAAFAARTEPVFLAQVGKALLGKAFTLAPPDVTQARQLATDALARVEGGTEPEFIELANHARRLIQMLDESPAATEDDALTALPALAPLPPDAVRHPCTQPPPRAILLDSPWPRSSAPSMPFASSSSAR